MSPYLCWWQLQRVSQSNQHNPSLTSHHQVKLEELQDALSWICLLWYFEELPTVFSTPHGTQTYWPDSAEVFWGPRTSPKSLGCTRTSRPIPIQAWWVWHMRISALHFWCGQQKSLLGHSGLDTGSYWGPLCPSYPCRAWYWCFEFVWHSSPLKAACTLQPWCPQLLHAFSLIKRGEESFSFVTIFLFKRKKKGKKCHTAPPFRDSVCLAQATSVFILYFYMSWTLGTTCSTVANTPINLHSPVFVLVTSQKWG